MYRSVTESRLPGNRRRKALHRMEGVLIGIAIFVAIFMTLGWLSV